ncbi:hypothetical protein [Falsiruegeria litorea]|uniref:hypothetical protein n=1 Tax=Falsiruegeria litorea TaxID=1280831 RepID=UPI001BFEDA55|nr:hypothetical protein [Falsiruegeria litorea]MBT8169668.1 hypothetical protein [Falsiruegeria litorea]
MADDNVILEALGEILKDERANTNKQIGALANRIDTLDGNALIRSSAMAVADANLAALRNHAENVVLRRARHLKGDLPPVVKGAIG